MTYDGRRMTLIMDSKEQQRLMVVWWRSFDSNCQSVTLCVGWTLLVCTPLCRTSCSKYTNRSSIFRPSFLLVEGRKAHMSCVSFSSWVNQPVSRRTIHPSSSYPAISSDIYCTKYTSIRHVSPLIGLRAFWYQSIHRLAIFRINHVSRGRRKWNRTESV